MSTSQQEIGTFEDETLNHAKILVSIIIFSSVELNLVAFRDMGFPNNLFV